MPEAKAANFSIQKIEVVPTTMNEHVSCINGINYNTVRELEQRGIRAVADLQRRVDKEEFMKLKTKLDRQLRLIQKQPNWLASIPQYGSGI